MPRLPSIRALDFQPGERAPSLMAAVYFFCIMFAQFMLRPMREALGLESGVDSVRILFLITLGVMIIASLAFGLLASRVPRKTFIPVVYRVAMLFILAFALVFALRDPAAGGNLAGKAYYVWHSVFNLFVVSVFWGFMSDVFTLEQGKRLFGFIAVGGTAGALTGSTYASVLAEVLQPVGLCISAAVLLEVAAQLARVIGKRARSNLTAFCQTDEDDKPLRGYPFSGLSRVATSPYLIAIALVVLSYTIVSTLLYFEKLRIVDKAADTTQQAIQIFGSIEAFAQLGTIVLQVFLTAKLMRWLGVGGMLAIVPIVSLIGFAALMVAPDSQLLLVVTLFLATRRASNFALSKPARETLFTVLPREDKYKAKTLIDTVFYRGGDTVGTVIDGALARLTASVGIVALPISAAAMALSFWLGKREKMRDQSAPGDHLHTPARRIPAEQSQSTPVPVTPQ